MFEIVCMFPDIDTYNRGYSLALGRILIRCARYNESILIQAQPCPSWSEHAERFGGERLLKSFESPESSIYGFREFPFRISATIWSDDGPEKAMVDMTSEVIDHTLFFINRHFVYVLQKKLFRRIFFEESRTFEEFRIVGDIGRMMLAVMDLHRLSVNMGLQSIVWIRKLRKRVIHGVRSKKIKILDKVVYVFYEKSQIRLFSTIRLSESKRTPSPLRISHFLWTQKAYQPIVPSVLITRWQGTSGASGFLVRACPIAWELLHPMKSARSL